MIALPSPEVAERLRSLQQRLAVPGAEPQPHLTLKMPFRVRTRLAEVRQRVAEVARQTAPVCVSVRGVGGFPGPYSNAVYASVPRNPELEALHAALVRALDGSIVNVYPYTGEIELAQYAPHLTIASDLSDEDFARLLGRLQDQPIEGCFEITRMHLMRRDTRGRWRVVQSFPLGRRLPTESTVDSRQSTVRQGCVTADLMTSTPAALKGGPQAARPPGPPFRAAGGPDNY
ncbi:MAG: 2'-5' RNA ligase family protein [Chloroflexi bacterium]|nr:2'-5' RNA ligase family protein [Chloroflexota bacterium]